jgi:hypothetical protein
MLEEPLELGEPDTIKKANTMPDETKNTYWGWTWTFDTASQKTWFQNPRSNVGYSLEGLATDPIARTFIHGCMIATPTARAGLITEIHKIIDEAALADEEKLKFRRLVPTY